MKKAAWATSLFWVLCGVAAIPAVQRLNVHSWQGVIDEVRPFSVGWQTFACYVMAIILPLIGAVRIKPDYHHGISISEPVIGTGFPKWTYLVNSGIGFALPAVVPYAYEGIDKYVTMVRGHSSPLSIFLTFAAYIIGLIWWGRANSVGSKAD